MFRISILPILHVNLGCGKGKELEIDIKNKSNDQYDRLISEISACMSCLINNKKFNYQYMFQQNTCISDYCINVLDFVVFANCLYSWVNILGMKYNEYLKLNLFIEILFLL